MSPYYRALRRAMGKTRLLVPSVAAIIRDEANRLLLVHKTDESWSLPAGAIEPGETPEEAVIREVREETGYECERVQLMSAVGGPQFRYVYPNGDEVEYLVLLYRCLGKFQSLPSDTEEVKSLAYFHRHEMPVLELPYEQSQLFE
jgi:8-oxo-dGTP pyrophosphatase MutT (NUDIX family)